MATHRGTERRTAGGTRAARGGRQKRGPPVPHAIVDIGGSANGPPLAADPDVVRDRIPALLILCRVGERAVRCDPRRGKPHPPGGDHLAELPHATLGAEHIEEDLIAVDLIPWAKQGDAVNWLVSEAFGLHQGRSREAERAIEAAEAFMRGAPTPPGLDTRETIHAELLRVLAGHDDFWSRWLVETGVVK